MIKKTTCSSIKECLKKLQLKKTLAVSFIFLSLFLLFPAGVFNSSTKNEHIAEYLTDVVNNHTKSKQYAGLLVQPKEGSEKKVNNSETEFRYLYGTFKEKNATYISSINADKSHTVYIKNFDDGINYSFLNHDTGFSVVEYKGHFKTGVYPLELMFDGKHLGPSERQQLPEGKKYTSLIYISQTHANRLLDIKAATEIDPNKDWSHSLENYKKLMGNYINLEVDGVDYYYWIEDIYLEINYFYEAIVEVAGEFLMCGICPSYLNKQALFFLRNYTYQNKYYLDYSTTTYSTLDYEYNVLTQNFVDGFQIDYSILEFNSERNDVGSILFVVVSIILGLASLFFVFLSSYGSAWFDHLVLLLSLALPYIIFWLVYLATGNSLLFSSFSTSWMIGIVLIYFILYLVLLARKRYRGSK